MDLEFLVGDRNVVGGKEFQLDWSPNLLDGRLCDHGDLRRRIVANGRVDEEHEDGKPGQKQEEPGPSPVLARVLRDVDAQADVDRLEKQAKSHENQKAEEPARAAAPE